MSYCLNPACTNPNNSSHHQICQACGSELVLRNRYRATRILGRGGFATTFLATDQSLPGHPDCVIKQLRPVLTADHILEMSRQLFQREAKTLGKIGNHPQLPRLLDFFELEQDFYLVQEYVNGPTLQQEVRQSGPFNETMVVAVLREVLSLLEYLHGQNVIHRDIKPANIIRRSIDRKLVLIDFGAVKDQVSQTAIVNMQDQDQSALTSFAVGTPGFAPAEQMAMRPVYASDIYSLGVTCLYLLTGKSPKELNYDQTTGGTLLARADSCQFPLQHGAGQDVGDVCSRSVSVCARGGAGLGSAVAGVCLYSGCIRLPVPVTWRGLEIFHGSLWDESICDESTGGGSIDHCPCSYPEPKTDPNHGQWDEFQRRQRQP